MSNLFLIGNGESRKDFDLTKLRKHGKIYGCNALYREFTPDALISVDHGIIHEIYHSTYAWKNQCYFRDFEKIPEMHYDLMLAGMTSDVNKEDIEKLKQLKIIKENDRRGCKEFVIHGSRLEGFATIVKKNKDREKRNVNVATVNISWCKPNDKAVSLNDIMNPKDHGWAAGPTSGYIGCKVEKPTDVYLIGHDIYSNSNKVNNLYKNTKHYVHENNKNPPPENWIKQWNLLMKWNPDKTFYKVNIANKGNDEVNRIIPELDQPNLKYITYSTIDKIFDL